MGRPIDLVVMSRGEVSQDGATLDGETRRRPKRDVVLDRATNLRAANGRRRDRGASAGRAATFPMIHAATSTQVPATQVQAIPVQAIPVQAPAIAGLRIRDSGILALARRREAVRPVADRWVPAVWAAVPA